MELKVHDKEILLQNLWKSRKLFTKTLLTTTGKKIEVLFAGSENLDAGPDFKDAILKLEGKLLKGDIEIHLNDSGWYEHGHHTDPSYNDVILHVISEPEDAQFIEREDGVKVNQVHVALNVDKTQKGEEADQKSHLIVDNCPLSNEQEVKIFATIEEAGEQRLLLKAEQLNEDLSHCSWDQIIYKKLLEAMGYSKNQIPFRKLAELIPFETVSAEMQWVKDDVALKKCAAVLFGSAGLLPSQNKIKEKIDEDAREYIESVENFWDQISHRLAIKPMKSHEWQFFRLRPTNFPTRRIAALVQIMSRYYRDGFLNSMLKIFQSYAKNMNRLLAELENAYYVEATGFWRNHYRFEAASNSKKGQQESALIGKDRAKDVVVNIIFPALYLYSRESRDGKLKNLTREAYSRFPRLAENIITRAMRKQLFPNKKSRLITSALHQQGLIHLHKLYCNPLKCSECLALTPSTR